MALLPNSLVASASLLYSASSGAQFALTRALDSETSTIAIIGFVLAVVASSIPSIVASLLFVVIGWPLLLEISHLLRFKLPDFFYGNAVRQVLIIIAFLAGVSQSLVGAGFSFL